MAPVIAAKSQLQPLTITELFLKWEQLKPQQTYLRQPVGDAFIDYTWGEVGQQARRMATYLNSLSLPPGSNIGLVSKNCAHWIIADLAILLSGHVSVPFYPTLTAEQLQQVMVHSECPVLFAGKLDNDPNHWATMKPGVPDGVTLIGFPTYGPAGATAESSDRPNLVAWNTIMAQYEPLQEVSHLKPDDVEAVSLATGGTVYFAESLDTFAKNLAVANPMHFLAVPRVWTLCSPGMKTTRLSYGSEKDK